MVFGMMGPTSYWSRLTASPRKSIILARNDGVQIGETRQSSLVFATSVDLVIPRIPSSASLTQFPEDAPQASLSIFFYLEATNTHQ